MSNLMFLSRNVLFTKAGLYAFCRVNNEIQSTFLILSHMFSGPELSRP
jgi:hypothetical protein